MVIKKIYTHGNCVDGMAVAALARTYLPFAQIEYVDYNSEKHLSLKPEPHVLFADFTPHRHTLDTDGWVAADPVVLDHHEHAADVVSKFSRGHFDNSMCGAMLFLNWLKTNIGASTPYIVQKFAEMINAVDLHLVKDPYYEQGCELVATMDQLGTGIIDQMRISEIMAEASKYGAELVKARREAIRLNKIPTLRLLDTSVSGVSTRLYIGGGERSETSSVLHYVREDDKYSDHVVVALFRLMVEGNSVQWVYSLRSNTVDVGAFCKRQGGGGHALAAGYSINTAYGGYAADGAGWIDPFKDLTRRFRY